MEQSCSSIANQVQAKRTDYYDVLQAAQEKGFENLDRDQQFDVQSALIYQLSFENEKKKKELRSIKVQNARNVLTLSTIAIFSMYGGYFLGQYFCKCY